MLSVLIPVFNWDVRELVKTVHAQCKEQNLEFEILVFDDFSSDFNIREVNSKLALSRYSYVQSQKNVGNAEARNKLANLAKFDSLLFLDCDVNPVRKNFIKKYLEFASNQKVICGGILYEELKEKKYSLRWKFGKRHEEISSEESQKNPYLNIRGCNFFIPKEIFLENPFSTLHASYGYVDTFFALSLENAQVEVKHIDNPVFHLGLEENKVYLRKFEKSIQNAKWMIKAHPEIANKIRLVKVYKKIERLGLKKLIAFFFKQFEKSMLKNLHSESPSLFIFQLYKLGYISTLKEE